MKSNKKLIMGYTTEGAEGIIDVATFPDDATLQEIRNNYGNVIPVFIRSLDEFNDRATKEEMKLLEAFRDLKMAPHIVAMKLNLW